MKNTLNNIISPAVLVFLSIILSFCAFLFFYMNGQIHLDYGDAVSRLNISRKIIDNLNPGLGQIGAVWLPLPFILMLPFIWSNFLWQSGLAGYFVSGISFVATVYFLYKLGVLAFNSRLSGLVMSLLALTSLNLLYIQTTAMSESIFIATVTGSTYFLFKWAKNKQIGTLLYAAVLLSACSFIRYEGFFVLLLSLILVPIISALHHKSIRKAEGNTILFSTLALTGVIAWMIYNLAIFGNALYWKQIYTSQANIISSEVTETVVSSSTKSGFSISRLLDSAFAYWTSTAHMNGLIITVLATFLLVCMVLWIIFKRKYITHPEYLTLMIPIGVFAFVTYAVNGGFPLTQPSINFANFLTKETNNIGEYNIRYGINMLPLVLIPIGWALSLARPIQFVVLSLLTLQFVTVVTTPIFTLYSLPHNFMSTQASRHTGQNPAQKWLKRNYDGGLIMISAQNHNPTMFFMGIDYKNYIHEGAGKYWIDSRDNPQKYATWIYMYNVADNLQTDDLVAKYAALNRDKINTYFNEVYNDGRYVIYKIKTRPEIQIKQ